MDESGTIKDRRGRRSPVLLTATIDVGGAAVAVKLRNLSEQGALIEGASLPDADSTTWFERNDLRVKARVVWVQGNFAGVAFDEPLNPEQMLRAVPKPRPAAQLDFKRPGLACRPLSDYERRMLETWMTAPRVASLGE